MAVDILDHDDGIIDHQADGQDHRQQREQIDGVPQRHHDEGHTDKGQRDGHDRDRHRAQRPQEQKDHHDHDEGGLADGLDDLADRAADVTAAVVNDLPLHGWRQLLDDSGQGVAHLFDDLKGVGRGRGGDTDKHGLLTVEDHRGVVILRAELDLCDVVQTHQGVAHAFDHNVAELLGCVQIRIGADVDGVERALRLTGCGQVVVGHEPARHLGRRHIERRHLLRVEPDAHGEGLGPEYLGLRHAADGLELRLHHADEVVGDLLAAHLSAVKTQVHQGDAGAG